LCMFEYDLAFLSQKVHQFSEEQTNRTASIQLCSRNEIQHSTEILRGWTPHTIQSARLSFQSSELGPHPLTHKIVLLPHFGSKGGDTLACEGGGGWTNSDGGTDILVLYVHNTIIPLLSCLPQQQGIFQTKYFRLLSPQARYINAVS
jgi:hypothetical protein